MTVESGGSAKGCVEWSYQTLAKPSTSTPGRQLVYFRLVNKCGREVSVMIDSQTADYAQRVGENGGIVLEPGQSYGDAKTIRNYIFFNPPKDRFLNFWVFQSDRRFNAAISPDMNRCVPGFQPVRNSKRHYPACPPAFRYK
ncbi:MAG: hypothetical protein JHC57_06670 [Sphingopyxis sp.]|uniref:hypothetical protein n=1 Tax=Sphingopyxis sp. TaxID=1908224 RepID=UPI001A229985|nr:hypothetical protein [Sphingopyxis sp.]MBJ7499418.1 hypothetical protein [Sphingopyxis sp.]